MEILLGVNRTLAAGISSIFCYAALQMNNLELAAITGFMCAYFIDKTILLIIEDNK